MWLVHAKPNSAFANNSCWNPETPEQVRPPREESHCHSQNKSQTQRPRLRPIHIMFPQRNVFRFSQRAAQQLRAGGQRRFNSTQGDFPWAVDNEFNRERAAVKHHAAGTSGVYQLTSEF